MMSTTGAIQDQKPHAGSTAAACPSNHPHGLSIRVRDALHHPPSGDKKPSQIIWRDYGVGDHRIPCPVCGRGDRDKSVGLTIDDGGRGVAHCFRCRYVETYRPNGSAQQRPAKAIARPVTTAKRTTLADYAHEILRACRPIHGVARAYLEARRCVIPPEGSDLLFHPNLRHHTGYCGPALVGVITNVLTGLPMSLHRTWITATGEKADIERPRTVLWNHVKQGGCIRLWPDEWITHGLAVGEGVETCLSLGHAYQPVWSLIDAGNLGALPVLPGIEVLFIARDNDTAGIRGAATCAARWTAAGAEVRITLQAKNDLNDELQKDEVSA